MRFQIDEQREKLKEKIDVIALKMIDQIKNYEEIYSSSLQEKLLDFSSSFEQTQSLDNELNEIEATFRNPNLLIQSIKQMQQKQDESLRDIQFKLNEMNQVRDDLKASNEFGPNLSSFNQMGLLYLV
jgi:hypothetical protein